MWARVAADWEAKWKLSVNVHDEVFLLVAEPEIVVIIVNGGAPVAGVRGTVRVEHFAHHEVAVDTLRVRENVHGFEKAVRIAAIGLPGRGAIKHPDRAFFKGAFEI